MKPPAQLMLLSNGNAALGDFFGSLARHDDDAVGVLLPRCLPGRTNTSTYCDRPIHRFQLVASGPNSSCETPEPERVSLCEG